MFLLETPIEFVVALFLFLTGLCYIFLVLSADPIVRDNRANLKA